MLQQFVIPMDGSLPDWAAYGLYAQLLERTPRAFAGALHETGFTPVSQYVCADRWCLTALNGAAAQVLEQALEGFDRVTLHRLGREVRLGTPRIWTIEDPAQFLESALPASVKLRFLTPTAFKSGGYYRLLPTETLLLKSLVQRWNGCFGEECPIEDSGGGLEAMAQGLIYRRVQLESRDFPMKNTQIPGTVGWIQAENRCKGFHRQLCAGLLEFGCFSGVGIKTALGMGGFAIDRQ